ncbi:uncharacterized protein LOC143364045, partial [Halictus rubicundus]|uniref:uncharacterized protein LOC143364045 n=1 Tax=Halictus rubicundus TaxID=77578 RepID=UPI004036A3D1
MLGKDEGFWRDLERWDAMVLLETWVEERMWEKVERKLPQGYVWKKQWAVRDSKIGRAKGGMDIERKMKAIRDWWDTGREEKIIVGGDFNARTGKEGGEIKQEEDDGEGSRESRDAKVNGEGRKLIKTLGELGLEIMNGGIEGDERGEYTYIGHRGRTVIDYVIGDKTARDGIESMVVEERVESDHLPVVVTMKKGRKSGDGGEIGERLGELEKKIKKVIEEVRSTESKKEKKKRGWWDNECMEGKKELRRVLRRWKEGKEEGERYRSTKNKYKKLCEEKKEQERERILIEAGKANTEGKVWEFLRKMRGGKGGGMMKEIEMETWKEYFMGLLGGVETKIEGGGKRRGRGTGEEEIGMEEIERVIRRLKDGKAAGEDEMGNEIWRYGGENIRREVWKICNGVWNGEGWPEEWKTGVVVPIKKKGDGRTVECYRGVTLLNTLYKIYTIVLEERLEKEVQEKRMVPENQTGFRKEKGTIDNIYVLNYIINRELAKKKGRILGCFIDLKAAFDSVNRSILWKELEERGVSEGIRERIEEVYRETTARVKVGDEMGEKFWVGRGVRQGCPLSAKLFILFMADLEERMTRRGKGGVEVRGKMLYTLQYADDLVLLAKEESGMRLMIEEFRMYIKEKGLEVNREKTKIIRFERRRQEKKTWRWGDGTIEEVEEVKYLGYIFKKNGGQERQIEDRIRKGGGAMRSVWGIGKRHFKDKYKRREWLFDVLVWPVMAYGVEIWGWEERKEVERTQERYIRWVLGVEWTTPGYMIREETKREKMRIRGARRAWRFEERLRAGKGSEWARLCLQEIEERARGRKKISRWEKGRKEYIEERGDRRREIRVQERPEYLEKATKEEKWRRVARYRLGNEMRGGRYWEEEEERRCRRCGYEEETWKCAQGKKERMQGYKR